MKMKILTVAPYYFPYTSGMTVYLKRLLEELALRGYETTILTSKHEKNLPAEERINDVEVIRAPILFRFQRGSFTPNLWLKLAEISRDFDVVNIHAPFFEAGLLSSTARKKEVKNIILTYHCDLNMRGGFIPKIIEEIYYISVKYAAAKADTVVVNSLEYLQNSRLRDYSKKAVEIYPPIDVKHFNKTSDTEEFKRRHNINPGDVVVGFVGRLTREKGVTYLLEALPKVMEEIPEVKLLIAGESRKIAGGLKESVIKKAEEIIKKNNLTNVYFTGYLSDDDLVRFYSTCSLFVLPSTNPLESFGMVQVEAMLCGCPVVASDLPGIRTPVELTGFGILAKPRDSLSLAEAIVRVLKDVDRFKVDRRKVVEFFGVDKTAAGYEKLFIG